MIFIILKKHFIFRRPGDDGGSGGSGSHPGGQPPRDPPGPRPDGSDGGSGVQLSTGASDRSALNTPEQGPHDHEEEFSIPLVTIKEEVPVNRSAPPPTRPPAGNRAPVRATTPRVRLYSELELRQLHSRAIHAHSTSSRYAGVCFYSLFFIPP